MTTSQNILSWLSLPAFLLVAAVEVLLLGRGTEDIDGLD
jgi:hypothetical protein